MTAWCLLLGRGNLRGMPIYSATLNPSDVYNSILGDLRIRGVLYCTISTTMYVLASVLRCMFSELYTDNARFPGTPITYSHYAIGSKGILCRIATKDYIYCDLFQGRAGTTTSP